MGYFDFLRRRPRPTARVSRTREEGNDLSWWWFYIQQQSMAGDDTAVRQMEEVCRQYGVDPQGQATTDVGSVPGLEAALAETCRSSGMEVPAGDTVITYDAMTGTTEVSGSVDAGGSSGGEPGGGGSDFGGGGGSGGGGGDSGGGGGDSGGGGGGGGD